MTALVVQNFLEDLMSSLYFNGKYVEPKHLRTKIPRVEVHEVNMTVKTTDKELRNSVTCSQFRPELSDSSDSTLSLSGEEVQRQLATNGKFMFTFDIPCFSLFFTATTASWVSTRKQTAMGKPSWNNASWPGHTEKDAQWLNENQREPPVATQTGSAVSCEMGEYLVKNFPKTR